MSADRPDINLVCQIFELLAPEKNMLTITNAFSLNMLPADFDAGKISITKLEVSAVKRYIQYLGALGDRVQSAVGHEDTAAVFSSVLDMHIPMNRTSVVLNEGDTILVGQYKGPRLPEGCKTLPEGATIEWYRITLTKSLA